MTTQELEGLAKERKFSEWLDEYIQENKKFLESVDRPTYLFPFYAH